MSGISNVGMARQIRLVKDVQELRSAQHQKASTVAIGNHVEILQLLLAKL